MGNNCCCGERQHEQFLTDANGGRRRKPLTRAEKVAVLKQAFSRHGKSDGAATPQRRRAPSFLQGPGSPQTAPPLDFAPPRRRREQTQRRSLSEEPEWRLYDDASGSSQPAHSVGRSKSPLFKAAARGVVAAHRWASPAQSRGNSSTRAPYETGATLTPPSGRSLASTPTRGMNSQRKNEALEGLLKALAQDPGATPSRAPGGVGVRAESESPPKEGGGGVAAAASASSASPPCISQQQHQQHQQPHLHEAAAEAELERLRLESGELAKLRRDLHAEVVRQTGLAGSGEAPTDWNGLPTDADPELRRLWQKYDLDGKGHLTPQQLQLILQEQADRTERERLALDKRHAEAERDALRQQLLREQQRVENLARLAEARVVEKPADHVKDMPVGSASSVGAAPSYASEHHNRHAATAIGFMPREEQALMHGEFSGRHTGVAVGAAHIEPPRHATSTNFLTAAPDEKHRQRKREKKYRHHRDAHD